METAVLDPEFANLALPKWPQLYFTGKPLEEAQAKEIIFATDRFLTSLCSSGGNNHHWEKAVARRMGVAEYHRNYSLPAEQSMKFWAFERAWRREAKSLSTEYVHNTWAASCYIGGPYGWCHPTGKILYSDNIGKWPNVTEVFSDLSAIAKAWPFLEAAATLMNGEHCEMTTPVITFIIKDGVVTAKEPGEKYLADHYSAERGADPTLSFIANFNKGNREQGLPQEWVDEYADRVAAFIKAGGGIDAIADAENARDKESK